MGGLNRFGGLSAGIWCGLFGDGDEDNGGVGRGGFFVAYRPKVVAGKGECGEDGEYGEGKERLVAVLGAVAG